MSKDSFRISRTTDHAMSLKDAHIPWHVEYGVPLWIWGAVLLFAASIVAIIVGLL